MGTLESRQFTAQLRRVQLLLLLMILWDLIAVLAELSFGNFLIKIDDGTIDGVLGARASFSGAAILPIGLYFYALVRGPARYQFVLWCAALEHGAVALFGVYHVALDDVEVSAAFVPIAVSILFLVLSLINMPGTSRSAVAAA